MSRAPRRSAFKRFNVRSSLLKKLALCAACLTFVAASAWALAPARAEKGGDPRAKSNANAPSAAAGKSASADGSAAADYGRLPLGFEPNRGQADARAEFVVRGGGFDLFLAAGEAVFRTNGAAEPLRMKVVGADPRSRGEALEPLAGVSNYFVGRDSSRWLTDVPRFARVRYGSVYPGIDLDFYGNPQQLEYDFRLAPGADPSRIALSFRGARSVRLGAEGDLLLSTRGGEVRLLRPVAYQEAPGGERHGVEARYRVEGRRVSFRLGAYDARLPLVIDPVVAYASFLGGSGDDRGLGIAVDSQGSAYVAGLTTSLNFPLRGAPKGSPTGPSDAFVAKLSPDGSSLVYATYFGGSGTEQARAVAVDAQGSAYITGTTDSTDLPAVNAFQPARGSTSNFLDAFVAKLSPSGSALAYSTYLGGFRPDEGDAIAVDAAGSAYVAGSTGSYNTGNAAARPFPVTAGAFQTNFPGGQPDGGNAAAFVSKLTPAGDALEYSTFLGGLGNSAATGPTDIAFGVAVDSSGAAYVTGRTESHRFPVVSAAQPAYGGGPSDAFLTKLAPSGGSLVYSTFLGGAGEEDRSVGAVAVDAQGNAYATGATNSTDFPVTGALQPAYGGNPENEAFLTKLDAGGAYVFSTYVGANNFKRAFGVAVDADSNVYLAGTNSVRKVAASGAGVEYAVTLGGEGRGVALDPSGAAYVAGITTAPGTCSVAGFFPSASAFQRSYGGGANDAFVTKVAPGSPSAPATFPVQINVGAFTGRYIVGGVGQLQGSVVLNLAPGTYSFDAFGNVAGSSFNFTVGPAGQLTGLTNNTAAQLCGNTLQLRTVTINVDPQGYAAQYLVSTQEFGTGYRTFTVVPGLTYIFESGGVVGGSAFQFNVGAGGAISGVSSPASATASGNTLTLTNASVVVRPGGYAGGYSINRLPFAYGEQTFTLVPGLRYALESGAVVGGSAFTFTLGADGSVVNIQLPEAATASGNTVNFNNVVVYVDPTTYAGAYQVQQGYTNLSGQRAVTLIPGLVAFAGAAGGGAYFTPTQTAVTPSSGVVNVNGQNHTFRFSLTPPSTVNIGGFTFSLDAPPDEAVILSNPVSAILATSFACSGVDLSTLPTIQQKVRRVLTDANTGTQVLDRAQFEARYTDRVIVNEPGPDFYVFEIGSGNGNEPFALSVYDPAQGAYTPYVTLPTTPTSYFTCSNLRINYAAVDLSDLGFAAGARVSRLRFDNLRDPAVNSSGADISDIMAVHLGAPECAAAGPVSLWRGEGDATDSADGNDGVGLADGLSYAPGRVGSAFSFNGVDDDVQVEDANNLDLTNKFTFELWMKADSLDGFQDYLLSKVDDENRPARDNAYSIIWEYLDNKVEFYAGGVFNANFTGDDPRPGSAIPVNDTNWHHIAYTYDGANWSGYLDGEQVFSVQRSFSLLKSPGRLHLGTFGATAHGQTYFKGMLDEVAIYNRALSAAEIRAIHDAGSAGKCQPTNRAPAADAGPDQTFTAAGPVVLASLDGSASSDPDGDALAYEWRDADDNVVGNTAAVVVPVNLGANVFTLTVTDPSGASASDSVTVTVSDDAAPVTTAQVSPPANGAGWHNSDVTVSLTAADDAGGSGVREVTYSAAGARNAAQTTTPGASASLVVSAEGETVVTYFATDNAGNREEARTLVVKLDKTAPEITASAATAAGAYSPGTWTGLDVTVSFGCTDAGSGVSSVTAPAVLGADGADQSAAGVCADAAGNTARATFDDVDVDKTAPSVNCGAADGLWHAADVQIPCAASDAGSGLASASDASFALSTAVPAGAEDANASTGSRQVCDGVGRCVTAGPVAGNKVDRKAPDINIVSPQQGASYTTGQSVAAGYACADGGSGLAACAGTAANGGALDTSSVGVKSFAVTASDAAGNTTTKTVTYFVGYGICALYDQTKAHRPGSTISVKLRLCGPNGENLSAAGVAVTALGTVRLSDFAPGEVEDSGQANPDDDFRFTTLDGAGGYIFNLQTKGLTTGTYVLVFKAGGDPLTHGVQFQIK